METGRKQDTSNGRKSGESGGGNKIMEELIKLISTYGVSFVIVALFLWDYIANKKTSASNQEMIKNTLTAVEKSTTTISSCLIEMQQTNLNTAKSLELLQKQMENTDKKIDMLLERGDK